MTQNNPETSKVAIRADASASIGTGHLFRCLALAIRLKEHGVSVCFISRHMPDYLKLLLSDRKIPIFLIGSGKDPKPTAELFHSHLLGTTQNTDAQQTLVILDGVDYDWLIVDHYGLDFRWERQVRQSARKIMVLDDLQDRRHDCDLLLDQNCFEAEVCDYKNKIPAHSESLLGPRYALLRDEFMEFNNSIRERSGKVNRVFVSFGGVDRDNFTTRVLQAIKKSIPEEVIVDVVVGNQNSNSSAIENYCKLHSYNFHKQPNNLGNLMHNADIGIGAGGISLWERCCVGLPSFAIETARNQERQLDQASKLGLVYAPKFDRDSCSQLCKHLKSFVENSAQLRSISKLGLNAVDGKGVNRVSANLIAHIIKFRYATLDDAENLLRWRNHSKVRLASEIKKRVVWAEHIKWLNDTIASEKKILLIGLLCDEPIGIVRFDISEQKATISIYLVPKKIGTGLGFALLKASEIWISKNVKKVEFLQARVLDSNKASKKLFMNSGFNPEGQILTKVIR